MDDTIREMLESMKAEHRRLDEQISALSAEPSTPAFETRKPAAIEMISAGIWLTRPSPIVRRV